MAVMIAGVVLAIPLWFAFSARSGHPVQRATRESVTSQFIADAHSGVAPASCRPRLDASVCRRDGGATVPSEDAEVRRIQADLERVRHDDAARQAFYERIERLVDCVRTGREISPSLTVRAEWPAPVQSISASATTAAPAPTFQSSGPPLDSLLSSLSPPSPQEMTPAWRHHVWKIESPRGEVINTHLVSRLLYWAGKNGCPPELALATAWQESRLSLRPPDGTSGEIGMMQILPARARTEGVDPRTLYDPDVDMWLGTKLLARYYREDGSITHAAMMYVAGPHVFDRPYPLEVRRYIEWYSSSVQSYANYFSRYLNF